MLNAVCKMCLFASITATKLKMKTYLILVDVSQLVLLAIFKLNLFPSTNIKVWFIKVTINANCNLRNLTFSSINALLVKLKACTNCSKHYSIDTVGYSQKQLSIHTFTVPVICRVCLFLYVTVVNYVMDF